MNKKKNLLLAYWLGIIKIASWHILFLFWTNIWLLTITTQLTNLLLFWVLKFLTKYTKSPLQYLLFRGSAFYVFSHCVLMFVHRALTIPRPHISLVSKYMTYIYYIVQMCYLLLCALVVLTLPHYSIRWLW